MTDSEFKIWAALKILELRKELGCANSFFTTGELDMLFNIRDNNQAKINRQNKGKIINLFD